MINMTSRQILTATRAIRKVAIILDTLVAIMRKRESYLVTMCATYLTLLLGDMIIASTIRIIRTTITTINIADTNMDIKALRALIKYPLKPTTSGADSTDQSPLLTPKILV